MSGQQSFGMDHKTNPRKATILDLYYRIPCVHSMGQSAYVTKPTTITANRRISTCCIQSQTVLITELPTSQCLSPKQRGAPFLVLLQSRNSAITLRLAAAIIGPLSPKQSKPSISEVGGVVNQWSFFKAWAINIKHMHTPPAITATIPTDERTIHSTVPP